MRILFLLSIALACGCSPTKKQMTCSYLAMTVPDSINHRFEWKSIRHLPQKDGPVIFKWETDSTMSIAYTPLLNVPPVTFTKKNLSGNDDIHSEPTLLNETFKLDGTYENDTYKGSGIFFIVYVSKSAVLIQLCESMTLRSGVFYYAKDSVNQFEKAGLTFPFNTSTH